MFNRLAKKWAQESLASPKTQVTEFTSSLMENNDEQLIVSEDPV